MILGEIFDEKPYGHEFGEAFFVNLPAFYTSAWTGNVENGTKLFVFINTN
jgi:hypothetical protein